MPVVQRVLDPSAVASLDDYVVAGGGRGLLAARNLQPDAAVEIVLAAGIRGRGGAGFPTGVKWAGVARNASPLEPSTVVVNAAEGEPGSFKDREILRRNPYRVLEGALIAAHVMGADKVFIGMKRNAVRSITRLRDAIAEIDEAGWLENIAVSVVEGPPEYLLGEETGLLEVIDGRPPFPRIAPPYRRGTDEVVEHPDDIDSGSGLSAHVEMAAPGDESWAPPTVVDNVETIAHVALAFTHGADWFRSVGTADSPGTVVCTVSGDTVRAGVGEFAMGTPLREVLDELGGGMPPGRSIQLVLQGVASSVVTPDRLDVPVSWEGFTAIGSGLGAAAFIVCDDRTRPVAVASAVSRFLAVESCGQCTPCKQDGLAISDALAKLCTGRGGRVDLDVARRRLQSVADSARCTLATQHQVVVQSIVDRFAADFEAHADRTAGAAAAVEVIPMLDLAADGVAVLDTEQHAKQPDWTFDHIDSGRAPADRLDDHRTHEQL